MKVHFQLARKTSSLQRFWRMLPSVTCLAGLVISGCSHDDGVGRQPVVGIVSLDGKPLDNGSIRFEPQNGSAIASGAVIKEGQFRMDPTAGLPDGKYKVAISAPEGGSSAPSMPDAKATPPRERIPAKYNLSTTLSIDLDAKNSKDLKFDLVSK